MPQRMHDPNVIFERNIFDCKASCTRQPSCNMLSVLNSQLLGPSGLLGKVHLKGMNVIRAAAHSQAGDVSVQQIKIRTACNGYAIMRRCRQQLLFQNSGAWDNMRALRYVKDVDH